MDDLIASSNRSISGSQNTHKRLMKEWVVCEKTLIEHIEREIEFFKGIMMRNFTDREIRRGAADIIEKAVREIAEGRDRIKKHEEELKL